MVLGVRAMWSPIPRPLIIILVCMLHGCDYGEAFDCTLPLQSEARTSKCLLSIATSAYPEHAITEFSFYAPIPTPSNLIHQSLTDTLPDRPVVVINLKDGSDWFRVFEDMPRFNSPDVAAFTGGKILFVGGTSIDARTIEIAESYGLQTKWVLEGPNGKLKLADSQNFHSPSCVEFESGQIKCSYIDRYGMHCEPTTESWNTCRRRPITP